MMAIDDMKRVGKNSKYQEKVVMVFIISASTCCAPNSFGMIGGNLILGDPYSTLWPSTMLIVDPLRGFG
jgi:hypothetical protein